MWRSLVDFLWPAACPLCLTGDRDVLCDRCREQVAVLLDGERQVPVKGPTIALACIPYEEPLRRLLLEAKYEGNTHPLTALADVLVRTMPDAQLLDDPEVVIPVPLSWSRRRRRGHDQVVPLASAVAGALGRPLWCRALRRRLGGDAQSSLSAEARRRNLRGRFRARGVAGRRVVLVDDVVTTGATLEAATRALLDAGAAGVSALCLFRTRLSGSRLDQK